MFFRLINRTEWSFLFSFRAFFIFLTSPASELRRRRRPLPHPWPLHQPERTRASRQPSANSSASVNLLSFPPQIWPRVSQFFSVFIVYFLLIRQIFSRIRKSLLCAMIVVWSSPSLMHLKTIDLYERFAHWFGTAPLNHQVFISFLNLLQIQCYKEILWNLFLRTCPSAMLRSGGLTL